eukprot:CAMPEP_0179887482 /NCGR_PEP_ID=MMETSP0982-20121206/31434_1 /TAXON_ID=483367 /ORGANISM="non described non described, Strain CCMP 2436" /LENGTH=55 /DNA_ID=CAMNT_0021783325 /DNA_START=14 /DNA_END=181 /DNA_ORIENTATION=+
MQKDLTEDRETQRFACPVEADVRRADTASRPACSRDLGTAFRYIAKGSHPSHIPH